MHDTLIGAEWNNNNEEKYSAKEEEGGSSDKPCNELFDELELQEVSILRRMAKKGVDLTQLREEVRKLNYIIENAARYREDGPSLH